MYLIAVADNFAERINDAGFLVALVLVSLFYKEYKKQQVQMQHDEMLDRFLND